MADLSMTNFTLGNFTQHEASNIKSYLYLCIADYIIHALYDKFRFIVCSDWTGWFISIYRPGKKQSNDLTIKTNYWKWTSTSAELSLRHTAVVKTQDHSPSSFLSMIHVFSRFCQCVCNCVAAGPNQHSKIASSREIFYVRLKNRKHTLIQMIRMRNFQISIPWRFPN